MGRTLNALLKSWTCGLMPAGHRRLCTRESTE